MAMKKAPAPADDWEAQEAMRVIQRAEQHKADPKMMARVQKIAADHVKTLSKIAKPPAKAARGKK